MDGCVNSESVNQCPLTGTELDRVNHHWPAARAAALQRDGARCTVCGSDGAPDWLGWARLLLAILRPPTASSFAAWRDRQWPDIWESADPALRESLRRAYDAHRARLGLPHEAVAREAAEAEQRYRLEVHHLRPAGGRHSVDGCHHHLANLRTLCHQCHLGAERGLVLLAS